MSRLLSVIPLAFLIFSISFDTFSWNAIGHMVVANIAYKNLTPTAKTKVDGLLTFFQRDYPMVHTFGQLAVWPDTLHKQRVEMYSHWHYINLPLTESNAPVKDPSDTDNAVWAAGLLRNALHCIYGNNSERARNLGFLIHIVGDLHQPLHAVSRITKKYPNGDEGGNLYFVRYHRNTLVKLHTIWDDGLGVFTIQNTPEHVENLTNDIMAQFPAKSFGKKVDDLVFADWAKEDLELAKKYVYVTPEDQMISTNYVKTGTQVAAQQAALAGYRLAALLNQILT